MFITYSEFFLDNNIKVPRVEAHDHDKGFMLMEDFGDKVLQLEIDNENFDRFIKDSLETIISIQSCKPPSNLKISLVRTTLSKWVYLKNGSWIIF